LESLDNGRRNDSRVVIFNGSFTMENYCMTLEEKPHEEWVIKKGMIAVCIVVGCEKKTFSEGYCMEHYAHKAKEVKWGL